MKLTACIRVMISYVRKYALYGFRKINTNLLYHNSYNMYKKKHKKTQKNLILYVIQLSDRVYYVTFPA